MEKHIRLHLQLFLLASSSVEEDDRCWWGGGVGLMWCWGTRACEGIAEEMWEPGFENKTQLEHVCKGELN